MKSSFMGDSLRINVNQKENCFPSPCRAPWGKLPWCWAEQKQKKTNPIYLWDSLTMVGTFTWIFSSNLHYWVIQGIPRVKWFWNRWYCKVDGRGKCSFSLEEGIIFLSSRKFSEIVSQGSDQHTVKCNQMYERVIRVRIKR